MVSPMSNRVLISFSTDSSTWPSTQDYLIDNGDKLENTNTVKGDVQAEYLWLG